MPEPYGPLLRFALLTGGRIGEAIQLEPEQVTGELWTIPITKNGRPHTLPLTPTAAALAAAGWPKRGYQALFSHLVMLGVSWRPHDLRRTAATRMIEAGVSSDAVESVLNHSRAKLLRTYQQADPLPAMRDALARLDRAIAAVVTPPPQPLKLAA
jgi:integrase